MRRKETRSTTIYWLADTRTNMPFYCGKTVHEPVRRLRQHLLDARRFSHRSTAAIITRIISEGGTIRIQTMEVVLAGADWIAREKRWIDILRQMYPATITNVTIGGQGMSGYVPPESTRENMRAAHRRNSADPAYVKMKKDIALATVRSRKRNGKQGEQHSTETRALMSVSGKLAWVQRRLRATPL